MDEPSIFTKIINGDIPCHKVYEDGYTLAFLDIHPMRPGHVLVIPKKQIDHVDDLPQADYIALFETVRNTMKRVKTVLGAKRAVMLVMGYDVPHAHVHVIPADTGRDFYGAVAKAASGELAQTEPDHAALADMAAKLQF